MNDAKISKIIENGCRDCTSNLCGVKQCYEIKALFIPNSTSSPRLNRQPCLNCDNNYPYKIEGELKIKSFEFCFYCKFFYPGLKWNYFTRLKNRVEQMELAL